MRAAWLKAPTIAWKRGPLISDDAGTVTHVYWRNGALVDSKSAGWAMTGTVPMVSASGKTPPGAGPFSTSNYYTLGSGNDVLDFSGDFSICFVAVYAGAASGEIASAAPATGDAGWRVDLRSTDILFDTLAAGPTNTRTNTANGPVTGINVGFIGRTGTSQVAKLNLGTMATTASAKNTPATGAPSLLGVYPGPAIPYVSTILEFWASTTTPTDALFISMANSLKASMGITSW